MIRSPALYCLAAATVLLSSTAVSAAEVEHYSGKEAKTLEEAVANLDAYNDRLAKLLQQENLSGEELAQVHKLSYTLENALKRIRTELGTMAGDLETMHLASERGESDTTRERGRAFLEQVRTLTGK